jgi:hypothetical protein
MASFRPAAYSADGMNVVRRFDLAAPRQMSRLT